MLLYGLFSLLVYPIGLHASPDSSPQLDDIVRLLKSGANDQVLNLATDRLKRSPRSCALYSLQGMAFSALRQPGEALHSFEHAATLCPMDLAALEGAAQIRYSQKDPKAIPLLERIIRIQPTNQPAHAMLASSLRNAGDCSAALPHYEASREAFVAKSEWMEGRGACLAATGNYVDALNQYQALQEQDPSDPNCYRIAWLQSKNGNNQQAFTTMKPLLAEATNPSALSFGSYLAESLGDTPQAVSLLRQAIVLQPDNVQNYIDFANIAFAHKSFPVGISMVNAGLNRLPDAAPLYLARGILKAQTADQTASAIEDFEHAHQLDPKMSLSLDAIGIAKTQQYNDTASRELFEHQAKLSPDDPVLQYLLAEQLSQTSQSNAENLDRAVRAAQKATILDPHYVPARDLLAKLYLRANQPNLAMEQAEKALQDDPTDQEALYQKLVAARHSGDRAAVRELSQQFEAIRTANAEHQKTVDRFRLEEVRAP